MVRESLFTVIIISTLYGIRFVSFLFWFKINPTSFDNNYYSLFSQFNFQSLNNIIMMFFNKEYESIKHLFNNKALIFNNVFGIKK